MYDVQRTICVTLLNKTKLGYLKAKTSFQGQALGVLTFECSHYDGYYVLK